MSLNKGQRAAAKYISNWWKCNSMYLVLDAPAGTGKTYLIDTVLPTLINCDPILLTPTNESLKQLRDKIDSPENYELRTIHSALGITPTTSSKELKFEIKGKLPSLWDKFNLCILDEASMVSEEILEVLISIGIKILWIGHRSQLPPIDIKRKRLDLCISPVFNKGWETITLKEPMRNSGDLWEFTKKAEECIEKTKKLLPETFDVRKKDLQAYLTSNESKEKFFSGKLKLVMWSNAGVDKYNSYVRNILFGRDKAKIKYLKDDLIILTKPYNIIDYLDRYKESGLFQLMKDKDAIHYLYSNSKATVVSCKEVVVNLNSELIIPCFKLKVICGEEKHWFYEAIDKKDPEKIANYYEHLAWSKKTTEARKKIYRQRHFILSCFAEIKHYFAATSHRLQGSSIEEVVVLSNDILKNSNPVERNKCMYVSVSRASKDLKIFKGLL